MPDIAELFKDNVKDLRVTTWPQATGLCPFHDDHHPSFRGNLENGLWKCHACGKSGNLKSFLELKGKDLALGIAATICGPENAAAALASYSGGGKLVPMRMRDLISAVKASGEENDEWFLENTIAAGTVNIIVGPPKSGKTTLLTEAIAAISRGELFLGLQTKRVKSLWIGLEERRRDVAGRFQALQAWKGIRYQAGPLRASPAFFHDLEEYATSEGIRLVVIDTLANFWQLRDENSASETERALEPLRTLARKLGVAFVLLHHTRKGEVMGGESIRGSSAIFGVVDASVVLGPCKDQGETGRILRVESRLSGHWDLRIDRKERRYRAVTKSDLTARDERVLGRMTDKKQTAEEVCAELGLEGTTARRTCDALASKLPKRIKVAGSGRKGDPRTYRLRRA